MTELLRSTFGISCEPVTVPALDAHVIAAYVIIDTFGPECNLADAWAEHESHEGPRFAGPPCVPCMLSQRGYRNDVETPEVSKARAMVDLAATIIVQGGPIVVRQRWHLLATEAGE